MTSFPFVELVSTSLIYFVIISAAVSICSHRFGSDPTPLSIIAHGLITWLGNNVLLYFLLLSVSREMDESNLLNAA